MNRALAAILANVITAEEIIQKVKEFTDSTLSRDEVLRETVSILKRERSSCNWVGIYLLECDALVLHNYIGKPTEHTHIPVGRGVCGAAVADRENKIVDDVVQEANYLACSLETRAEIVVLIRRGEDIFGQIDIDSDTERAFQKGDEEMLSKVAQVLASRFQ